MPFSFCCIAIGDLQSVLVDMVQYFFGYFFNGQTDPMSVPVSYFVLVSAVSCSFCFVVLILPLVLFDVAWCGCFFLLCFPSMFVFMFGGVFSVTSYCPKHAIWT